MLNINNKMQTPVVFGQQIYFFAISKGEKIYLRCKGFLDHKVYINESYDENCLFKIQKPTDLLAANTEKITYGNQILIKHHLSSEFLMVKSDGGISRLFLKKDVTKQSLFTIEPLNDAFSSGDFIFAENEIAIKNVATGRFINNSDNSMIFELIQNQVTNKLKSYGEQNQKQMKNFLRECDIQKVAKQLTFKMCLIEGIQSTLFDQRIRFELYKEIFISALANFAAELKNQINFVKLFNVNSISYHTQLTGLQKKILRFIQQYSCIQAYSLQTQFSDQLQQLLKHIQKKSNQILALKLHLITNKQPPQVKNLFRENYSIQLAQKTLYNLLELLKFNLGKLQLKTNLQQKNKKLIEIFQNYIQLIVKIQQPDSPLKKSHKNSQKINGSLLKNIEIDIENAMFETQWKNSTFEKMFADFFQKITVKYPQIKTVQIQQIQHILQYFSSQQFCVNLFKDQINKKQADAAYNLQTFQQNIYLEFKSLLSIAFINFKYQYQEFCQFDSPTELDNFKQEQSLMLLQIINQFTSMIEHINLTNESDLSLMKNTICVLINQKLKELQQNISSSEASHQNSQKLKIFYCKLLKDIEQKIYFELNRLKFSLYYAEQIASIKSSQENQITLQFYELIPKFIFNQTYRLLSQLKDKEILSLVQNFQKQIEKQYQDECREYQLICSFIQPFIQKLKNSQEIEPQKHDQVTNQENVKSLKSLQINASVNLAHQPQALLKKIRLLENLFQIYQNPKQFPYIEKIRLYSILIAKRSPQYVRKIKKFPNNIDNVLAYSKIFTPESALGFAQMTSEPVNRNWRIQIKNQSNWSNVGNFKDGDLFVIIDAHTNNILNVNLRRQLKLQYRQTSRYPLTSIFTIKQQSNGFFYVKHVLTDRYFPFQNNCRQSSQDKDIPKKIFQLEHLNNLLEDHVYNIYFDKKIFKRQKLNTEAFIIKKVTFPELPWCMSLKGMDILGYIDQCISIIEHDTIKWQDIFRQIGLIEYMIVLIQLSPESEKLDKYFKLLYKICLNNTFSRRRCKNYMYFLFQSFFKTKDIQLYKQLMIQSQSQKLTFLQKVEQSTLAVLKQQFIEYQNRRLLYMRLFNLICGELDKKICHTNQRNFFELFFLDASQEHTFEDRNENNKQKYIIPLPQQLRYKMTWNKSKEQFVLYKGKIPINFNLLEPDQQQYVKQYFLLISNCLKNNAHCLSKFKQSYKLETLVRILQIIPYSQMFVPILKLIMTGYLQYQQRITFNIFYKNFDRPIIQNDIIPKSKMFIQNVKKHQNKRPQYQILISWIKNKIKFITFPPKCHVVAVLLTMIRMTLQSGFWIEDTYLMKIIDITATILDQQQQKVSIFEHQKVLLENTLLQNKLECVKIRKTIFDIFVFEDIWDVLTCGQKLETVICNFMQGLAKAENKGNTKLFVTKSEQLKLQLFKFQYRILNYGKFVYNLYEEAKNEFECQEKTPLKTIFCNFEFPLKTVESKFNVIKYIAPDCQFQQFTIEHLKRAAQKNMLCPLTYKTFRQQIQHIGYKLGLHHSIIIQLQKFLDTHQNDRTLSLYQDAYWNLYLLHVLTKKQPKHNSFLVQKRNVFLQFLKTNDQHMLFYISSCILKEIYKGNPKLILKDNNQDLNIICNELKSNLLEQKDHILIKDCEMLSLLFIFLYASNRKVPSNYQQISNSLLTQMNFRVLLKISENITKRHSKAQSIQEQQINLVNIFNTQFYILLFQIGPQLGRKYAAMAQLYFSHNNLSRQQCSNKLLIIPSLENLMNFIENFKFSNWELKGMFRKFAINLIEDINIMQTSKSILVLQSLLTDLKYICKQITKYKNKELSPELKFFLDSFPAFVAFFKIILDQCRSQCSSHPDPIKLGFILAIIQRLYLIMDYCPQAISNQLQIISNYLGQSKFFVPFFKQALEKSCGNKLPNHDIKKQIRITLQRLKTIDFTPEDIDNYDNFNTGLLLTKSFDISCPNLNFLATNSDEDEVIQSWGKMVNKDIKKLHFKIIMQNISEISMDSISFRDLPICVKEFFIAFLNDYLKKCDQVELQELRNNGNNGNKILELVFCLFVQQFNHQYFLFSTCYQLAAFLIVNNLFKHDILVQIMKRDKEKKLFGHIFVFYMQCLKTLQFYYDCSQGTINEYDLLLTNKGMIESTNQRRLCCTLIFNLTNFMNVCYASSDSFLNNFYQVEVQEFILNTKMKTFILDFSLKVLEKIYAIWERNLEQIFKRNKKMIKKEIFENMNPLIYIFINFLCALVNNQKRQKHILRIQHHVSKSFLVKLLGRLIGLRKHIGIENTKSIHYKHQNLFFFVEKSLTNLIKNILEQNQTETLELISKYVTKSEILSLIDHFFYQSQNKQHINHLINILTVSNLLKIVIEPGDINDKQLKQIQQFKNDLATVQINFNDRKVYSTILFKSNQFTIPKRWRSFFIKEIVQRQSSDQRMQHIVNFRKMMSLMINFYQGNQFCKEELLYRLFLTSLSMCFLILLFVVLFYQVGPEGFVIHKKDEQFLTVLSFIQFITSFVYLVLWGFFMNPIVKEKIKLQCCKNKHQNMSFVADIYFGQQQSMHTVALVGISLLGLLVDFRIYSVSLLLLFNKIDALSSIYSSFKLTWKQLITMFTLTFALSVVFGFLFLTQYLSSLASQDSLECSSISSCLDFLYTQGVIGEGVEKDEPKYYTRYISDILYWILFQTLIANIIGGVIIDKFAQQREIRQREKSQLQSRCLICSVKKQQLEEKSEEFQNHVKKDHNIWKYYYYIYQLQQKQSNNRSPIEKFVFKSLQSSSFHWLPSVNNKNSSIDEESVYAIGKNVTKSMQYGSEKIQLSQIYEDGDVIRFYKSILHEPRQSNLNQRSSISPQKSAFSPQKSSIGHQKSSISPQRNGISPSIRLLKLIEQPDSHERSGIEKKSKIKKQNMSLQKMLLTTLMDSNDKSSIS